MKNMQAKSTKKKVTWEVEEKIEDMEPSDQSLIEKEPDVEQEIYINSSKKIGKKTTSWELEQRELR